MTDYLHEKTAPAAANFKFAKSAAPIGKSTEARDAGGRCATAYRGLIRGLLAELKRELKVKRLPVIATGGYAKLNRLEVAGNLRCEAGPDA